MTLPIRRILLVSAFAVATLPTFAAAQTRCEQQAHDKKVTGTVIGGVLGAIAGNAIGKGGGKTGGTILGGVAGAAVGNNLARTHCPDGYAEVQDPYYVAPPTYQSSAPPPPYDGGGFWRQAPGDLRQRIDWMQARVDRARYERTLDPRQVSYALHELSDIRYLSNDLRTRDRGRLSPSDQQYLQDRLDTLSQNLRWARFDRR